MMHLSAPAAWEKSPPAVEYTLCTSSAPNLAAEPTRLLLLHAPRGRICLSVGGSNHTVEPGHLAVILPGESYAVISEEPFELHTVGICPASLLGAGAAVLIRACEERRLLTAAELAETEVPSLLLRMEQEWRQRLPGYRLSLHADAERLLLFLWRHLPKQAAENTSDTSASRQELVERAIAHVHLNYADLTEESTARACSVSAPYLSRSFKQCMGRSFSAFVNEIRLREAGRLLLTTNDSVTNIAQAVGFSTSAYFIAKFRETHGVTPKRYRKSGSSPLEPKGDLL